MEKVRGEGFCSLFQEIKGEDKFINYVVLRPTPAFSVFTSSIIDQGGRSLGFHPV